MNIFFLFQLIPQQNKCGFYSIFLQRRLIKNHLKLFMTDKKSLCKFDDYIEPKNVLLSYHSHTISNPLSPQFKLDKIFPKNINLKVSSESKQNAVANRQNKSIETFKFFNSTENKFYHEYMNAKEHHNKSLIKKNKIAHIFNIRSINLIEKIRFDRDKIQHHDRQRLKQKQSKQIKKNYVEKDQFKDLNFICIQKKNSQSLEKDFKRLAEKKNSVSYIQKGYTENKSVICMKVDNNFQNKLNQYNQYVRENCALHGLSMKEIQNYGRNSLIFYVGKGNNGHLIKELLKKRFWWTLSQEKTKKMNNFIWTQLKEKAYYLKDERSRSSLSLKRSQSQTKTKQIKNDSNETLADIIQTKIHNHFQNNEFLGNKKALYYNMKAFYQRQNKKVFDYLPVTFHVKRYDDQAWREFTQYYYQDQKQHASEGDSRRLWIVKPGQNSNRGNGITIYSDFQKIKQWVQNQISGSNNIKKTFIIQKYIDRPFLYNKRKFDIRCYMLLVRLNGKIKGYWYGQGYIRTSCYQFQLNDTENEFIHLTNDAIQVNSDKYGKYQDGNKLSYHNFQKYLDNSQKNHNFVQEIIPQLKKIATDSIQATYQLLGKWSGLPTFQIFGLDFMIDEDFKPWLIEINTNPCLQTSSTTLERVIPRMVDNAFKLSLDLLFPPPQTWQNSKKHYMPNRVTNNLFQLVFDQQKVNPGHSLSQEIILQMGEIEEDNEVYEEKGDKNIKVGDLELNL